MRIPAVIATLAALIWSTGSVSPMTLATDGETDCVIVLAEDAGAPQQTAAEELQHFLQQVTGAEFPLAAPGEAPEGAPAIVVGPNELFAAACPDIDLADLQHDGIVMRTIGDDLYLAGDPPRGTLYAVYTFLEDVVGCRWWSSTESFIPERPTLEIGELNTVHVPPLQYREAFYRDAFDGVFAPRLKINGHFERIPPERGGHYQIIGWCHTFNKLLPPETYFEEHPEWYSEINGERTAERAQLCLTNEEMRAELVRNALAWIADNPDAGIISISQNDCHNPCQCESCSALAEREGSEAGPLIHFVNAVAAEIEQQYPDVLVETLAYTYTRRPPLHVRPRQNVVVRLCTIECSFSQPLATGEQNQQFRDDIEGWSAIAPHLYIWNYVTNFRSYILPHPNLRVLAPNIRYFIDNNAVALFEQGDSGCSCSDFPELRAWLLGHLMWDPSRDADALIDEFLQGYYGPAAEPLRQYIDLIHDAAERSGVYLRCYMADTSAWLTVEDIARAIELFDEAMRRVEDDPELSRRVRRARMPLDHVRLLRTHSLRRAARLGGETAASAVLPEDPVAFCEDFIEAAHDFEVGNYREGRPFTEYEPKLRGLIQASAGAAPPAPEMCEGLPEDRWVVLEDAEFRLYGEGRWVSLVDDGHAADGRAARMVANHHEWATQCPIPAEIANVGPWHCYARFRCEANAEE
ncbi:MAG: DUF4838 domain-containing protein, partial [Armatimonadota bacterium]